MKAFRLIGFLFLAVVTFSCNKSGSSSTPSSAMSATVNGSAISFSASFNNSNGLILMNGTSNSTSIQLALKIAGSGGGTYTLGDPSTNFYATVGANLANYGTSSGYTGQAVVTQGSNGLYSGTFYFNAVETSPTAGGNSISVTSGSFSNM